MKRRFAAYMIVLVVTVSLTTTGCTSAPVIQEDTTGAVMDCPPQSTAEAKARRAVLNADEKARKEITEAYSDAERTAYRYAASMGRTPEDPPPPVSRPSKGKSSEVLRAEAEAAWRKWWELVNDQIDRYDGFLQKYPKQWYVRHRFACFLADVNLNDVAADEWEKVVEQEPRFPYALNNLGTLYNHMGRDKEAIVFYRKAVELIDDSVFWTNLAVNYSTHRAEAMELYGWDLPRTFQECLDAYRHARDLEPKSVDIAREIATQFVLAKYFNVTDTADEALKEWDYYLGLDLTKDQRIYGLVNVGRIYLREKNDPETAITWVEKALAIDEDNPAAKAVMKNAKEALAEREATPEEKEKE